MKKMQHMICHVDRSGASLLLHTYICDWFPRPFKCAPLHDFLQGDCPLVTQVTLVANQKDREVIWFEGLGVSQIIIPVKREQ
jgi:hypothetical protein